MKKKKMNFCTECPVEKTANLIEGKWTLLLVRDLLAGPKRYSELRDSVGEISPRILALRLKHLASHGLVVRKVFPTVPPSTEYSLTKAGRDLMPVIQAMAEFGSRFTKSASHPRN